MAIVKGVTHDCCNTIGNIDILQSTLHKGGITNCFKCIWKHNCCESNLFECIVANTGNRKVFNLWRDTGSSASDGGNVSDWYQAYQTLLEQYQDLTSESDYYRQYYLPDINRDGIPDLVLHLGTDITETTYHVFTFADGTLHECGNCSEKNGIEPEKIQTATVESETILSEDSSTTYFSLCYHGYQRTRYFRMTMDYQLECEDYSSKSDGQEVYDIPGEQLESCDIASLDLLNKAAGQ